MEREGGSSGPLITGFGPAGFRIGAASYPALLLTVEAALRWTPPPIDALGVDDLARLIETDPEFVLFGSGPMVRQPPAALIAELEAQGIGVDAMASRAAARAWGVLRSEGRRIAAALYPLT